MEGPPATIAGGPTIRKALVGQSILISVLELEKESFHPRKQGGKNGSKRQKVKTVKTDKIDMSGTTSSLTNAVLNVKSFQVVSLFSYTFLSFETTAVPTTL